LEVVIGGGGKEEREEVSGDNKIKPKFEHFIPSLFANVGEHCGLTGVALGWTCFKISN